ncbi:MAG: UDP-N-acetylmuramoyl-L-alanine--D-glutamate ligase [Opitutales bacterium]
MPKYTTDMVLDAAFPVAIFGMGVSGRGAAALLEKHGFSWVGYDSNSAFNRWKSEYAGTHRLVVLSPGFAPDHAWVRDAEAAGLRVISELDLAAHFWPGRIVAITGTNGKTTLTSFLAKVFNYAGFEAVAVGNIGDSFAGVLSRQSYSEQAVAVCEVSSFQAEQTHRVCWDGIIWTNFTEDHLERHGSMEDYFLAKAQLFKNVAPDAPIVVGKSVSEAARRFEVILPSSCFNGDFDAGEVIPSAFRSAAQTQNYRQACLFWRLWGGDIDALEQAAADYSLPSHRLERIPSRVDGPVFWDDSKATNFAATLAALDTFSEDPVVWIGGGLSKGGDLQNFTNKLSERITCAVLLGAEQNALKAALESRGIRVYTSSSMNDAVEQAVLFSTTLPSAQVLLSPGFSSLDEYPSYSARGLAFQKAVRASMDRDLIANP